MQKHIFTVGYCVVLVILSSCGGGSQENQDEQLEGQEEISATGIISVDTADATDLVRQPLEVVSQSTTSQGAVNTQDVNKEDLTGTNLSTNEITNIAKQQNAVTDLVVSESSSNVNFGIAEEQEATLAAANPVGEQDNQPIDQTEEIAVEETSAENNGEVTDQLPNVSALKTQPVLGTELLNDATAFPGALGWAAETTTGGRGGRVVIVDTLSNAVNPNDGVTSFREAMTEIDEPRIIVFSVAGLIDYRSGSSVPDSHIRNNNSDSNVTIACQTAPPPGVTLMGDGIVFTGATNNVIIRHCRFRSSDPVNVGSAENSSCIRATASSKEEVQRNFIVDHVSCMWAADDPLFFAIAKAGGDTGGNIEDITISNSIVAEGDADSLHKESGSIPNRYLHAMGPGCASASTVRTIDRCSIARNFIAHNARRSPQFWAVNEGEVINNIIYNPHEVAISPKKRNSTKLDAVIVGNLVQLGPTSKSTAKIMDTIGNSTSGSRLKITGNFVGQYRSNSVESYNNPPGQYSTTVSTQQVTPSLNIRDISREGSDHLRCVGASRPRRDSHDARVIEEFHQQSGQVGILGHHERDFSEYNTAPVQQSWSDADLDGMPDSWEIKMGVSEAADYDLSLDYSNLEVFLNGLALCPSVSFESDSISVPAGTREVEIAFDTTWETWAGGQTLEVCINNVCKSHDGLARRGSLIASLPSDANYQISMTPIGADGVPESVSDSIDVFVGQ